MSINFKFTDNSDKVLSESDAAILRALEAVGKQAEGHAKNELEKTPKRIDTGLLRNSITHALAGEPPAQSSYRVAKPSKDNPSGGIPSGEYHGQAPSDRKGKHSVFVGTNVKYATYVHNGTQKMAANRFIKNAVTENGDKYKRIVKKYLEG